MKNILCFGDSNTWGYAPATGERFPASIRWTGVLQRSLGDGYHVIEEGLNGRTTTRNEPDRPHRSGFDLLPVLLESHAPLDLVVMMLGTNDLKSHFERTPRGIAEQVKAVCQEVLDCEFLAGASTQVLLVSPTLVGEISGEDGLEFAGAGEKSRALSVHFRDVADVLGIHFLDAARMVRTSAVDGIHWDADQHLVFGKKLATTVEELLT